MNNIEAILGRNGLIHLKEYQRSNWPKLLAAMSEAYRQGMKDARQPENKVQESPLSEIRDHKTDCV